MHFFGQELATYMDSGRKVCFIHMLPSASPDDHMGSDPFGEVVDYKCCKDFLGDAVRFF
jgi:hypothetical protein